MHLERLTHLTHEFAAMTMFGAAEEVRTMFLSLLGYVVEVGEGPILAEIQNALASDRVQPGGGKGVLAHVLKNLGFDLPKLWREDVEPILVFARRQEEKENQSKRSIDWTRESTEQCIVHVRSEIEQAARDQAAALEVCQKEQKNVEQSRIHMMQARSPQPMGRH